MARRLSSSGALLLAACWAVAAAGGCVARGPAPAPPRPLAPTEPQRRMTAIADAVEAAFRESYAPAAYRAARFGWTLEAAMGDLRRVVATNPELPAAGFQRALHAFFRSTGDLDAVVRFEPGRAVWLGLHLRRTDDGYRIAWIDRERLPEALFGFRVGDEVLAFDGRPVQDAIDEVRAVTRWWSTPGYDQAMAERLLTYRTEADWGRAEVPLPGDAVELTIRSGRGEGERAARLSWLDARVAPPSEACAFWGVRGGVARLGAPLWAAEGDGALVPAYLFEHGGRRYGVLRVTSYDLGPEARVEAARELDRAIDEFLAQGIAALVVDQTGLPGSGADAGASSRAGLALLARLVDRPLPAPLQVGRDGASAAPTGPGALEPDPARGPAYTGPILLLVDELDGSAAEVVAATLQDGRRAVLLGATTSGAGGERRWVERHRLCPPDEVGPAAPTEEGCVPRELATVMERLGVAGFSVTTTLARRAGPEGSPGASFTPIANVGVAPDIAVEITAEDLRTGFEPYRRAVLDALERIAR